MLAFEKITDKDIHIANIYESETSNKIIQEVWFTHKFSGDSEIINDDVALDFLKLCMLMEISEFKPQALYETTLRVTLAMVQSCPHHDWHGNPPASTKKGLS